jgi:hypothetical protein
MWGWELYEWMGLWLPRVLLTYTVCVVSRHEPRVTFNYSTWGEFWNRPGICCNSVAQHACARRHPQLSPHGRIFPLHVAGLRERFLNVTRLRERFQHWPHVLYILAGIVYETPLIKSNCPFLNQLFNLIFPNTVYLLYRQRYNLLHRPLCNHSQTYYSPKRTTDIQSLEPIFLIK